MGPRWTQESLASRFLAAKSSALCNLPSATARGSRGLGWAVITSHRLLLLFDGSNYW